MSACIDSQINLQALEVLRFMGRNVQDRPMLYGLLLSDINRWEAMSDAEKRRVFERDVRRFSVACPHLSGKDRIKHALEALSISPMIFPASESLFATAQAS